MHFDRTAPGFRRARPLGVLHPRARPPEDRSELADMNRLGGEPRSERGGHADQTVSRSFSGASALASFGAPAEAQVPPATSDPPEASVNAQLLQRLERLEAELRDVRIQQGQGGRGPEVPGQPARGGAGGHAIPAVLAAPADPALGPGRPGRGSAIRATAKIRAKAVRPATAATGRPRTAATATRAAPAAGRCRPAAEAAGAAGGQGSVGRGERTGSRSPAGYKINTEYKYNFAGGYFSLFDDNKEFVANLQNMLVADGTFYDRQQPPTEQVGFNIPFQRLYLYGNITKNWEFQLSEQSSFGNFNLLDMLVNVHYDDRLMLKFGRFLAPFYYQDYATFPMLVPTISYSVVEPLSAMRQVGAMAWGKLWQEPGPVPGRHLQRHPQRLLRLRRQQGLHRLARRSPRSWPRDEQWLQNLGLRRQHRDRLAELHAQPRQNVVLIPGAGSPRLDFQYNTSSGVTYFQYNDNVRAWGNRTRVAPHFFWYGRFSVLAEYVVQSRKLADPTTQGISVQRGYYVQTSYFLTGERNTGDGTGGFPTIIPKHPLQPQPGRVRARGLGAGGAVLRAQRRQRGHRPRLRRPEVGDPRRRAAGRRQLVAQQVRPRELRLGLRQVQQARSPGRSTTTRPSSNGNRGRTNPIDEFNIFWTRLAFFF